MSPVPGMSVCPGHNRRRRDCIQCVNDPVKSPRFAADCFACAGGLSAWGSRCAKVPPRRPDQTLCSEKRQSFAFPLIVPGCAARVWLSERISDPGSDTAKRLGRGTRHPRHSPRLTPHRACGRKGCERRKERPRSARFGGSRSVGPVRKTPQRRRRLSRPDGSAPIMCAQDAAQAPRPDPSGSPARPRAGARPRPLRGLRKPGCGTDRANEPDRAY